MTSRDSLRSWKAKETGANLRVAAGVSGNEALTLEDIFWPRIVGSSSTRLSSVGWRAHEMLLAYVDSLFGRLLPFRCIATCAFCCTTMF